MTDGPTKPWQARARTLVVYCREDQWRFAIHNDAGIIDGALHDMSVDDPPEDAQAELLRHVEELTGRRYVARWKPDEPRWWSADLDVMSE